MWPFGKKNSNRRLERNRILDVKPPKKNRAAVVRAGAIAIFGAAATGAGVFGLWLGARWAVDEFVYHNEAFAVRTIDVATDGRIPVQLLEHWAGVRRGDNLMGLDLARIRRDLELVSLVDRAAVERVLPDTLRVRISERKPLAEVTFYRRAGDAWRAETFFLDGTAHVMAPLAKFWDPRPAEATLPILTGIPGTELRPGYAIQSPQVRAGLELITLFQRSSMARLVDLVAVDVSDRRVLVATTERGSQITFGMDHLWRQLNRWRLVHDFGQHTGRTIATLDLSIFNHVPARWLEDGESAPETRQPSPERKRNV